MKNFSIFTVHNLYTMWLNLYNEFLFFLRNRSEYNYFLYIEVINNLSKEIVLIESEIEIRGYDFSHEIYPYPYYSNYKKQELILLGS